MYCPRKKITTIPPSLIVRCKSIFDEKVMCTLSDLVDKTKYDNKIFQFAVEDCSEV